jgi:hypothetical protein
VHGFYITPLSNPLFKDWANQAGRRHVLYGTFQAQKVSIASTVSVGDDGHVGVYIRWLTNSEAFKKEKLEVQQRLGFYWRLEGIKFEQYSSP